MQLGNVIFIVWRESIEALLVIGILNAWLAHETEAGQRGGAGCFSGPVWPPVLGRPS